MGDLWRTGGLGEGEGLEGANREKKLEEKSQKSGKKIYKKISIGTELELTLNPFKTQKSLGNYLEKCPVRIWKR